MENWRELFDHPIIAMSNNKKDDREEFLVNNKDYDENVLSPVTNLMLDIIVKIFDSNQQNLIINFPKKILKPLPLIAYIFTEMKSKNVLVFTAGGIGNKNDLIRIHNDNFYLLSTRNQWDRGVNIYEYCSMGYIKSKGELAYKFFLPHAPSNLKEELNKKLDTIIGDKNKSKIILSGNSSFTSIIKTINKISIDNDDLEYNNANDMDSNIGCIIFENADRYFSSPHSAQYFLKWFKENVGQNIKVIFHFSTHDLDYLQSIKDLTNSKVISFNGGIIKKNDILVESSSTYFENVKNLDIVGRYNLDDEKDYSVKSKIVLDDKKLNQGNTDYFKYNAKKLSDYINDDEISSDSLYFNAKKLFLDLNNLTINPSFLKFRIKYQGVYSYVSVPQFIGYFKSSLKHESQNNRIYLRKYITLLNQFYLELSKRKRFFETNSYKNIGKDYRVFEIINNKEKIFGNDNDLIIGTFLNTEPGILNNQLKEYSNVEVKFVGNLLKEYFDSSNSNLLLPGFVPPRYLSELYIEYSKIFVLNYDGFNRQNIVQQIDSIEKPPITEETKVMNYFLELYEFLGMKTDNAFVKNYQKRLEKEEKERQEKLKEEEVKKEARAQEKEGELEDEEEYPGDVEGETEDYIDILQIIKNIEDRLKDNKSSGYITGTSTQPHYDIKTVELELKIPGKNEIIKKIVPAKYKYLHFKKDAVDNEEEDIKHFVDNEEGALEIKAEDLSEGDFVIILDNDRISFIDLFIEIFNLEENIDRYLADYWKDTLSLYVEKNDLSYEEFHELYKKEGGKRVLQTIKNWIDGLIIYPMDYRNELVYLAKVMDDDFLLNNIDIMGGEFKKIISLRISMGKNLKPILKGIIFDDFLLDYDLLSFEEQTMHNIIENSVYQVVNVG